ncbi:uncharacterized protein LOC116851052 [Odontomachus brunneus]|uniref:uncharacterized protein LOC116851052 n=1 Tax=Odontomachus brunneus TaxID=486640 RepID=UPI0013F21733|nr:uncharacterized protein LOC116851052 [Odontomachus brunneus]
MIHCLSTNESTLSKRFPNDADFSDVEAGNALGNERIRASSLRGRCSDRRGADVWECLIYRRVIASRIAFWRCNSFVLPFADANPLSAGRRGEGYKGPSARGWKWQGDEAQPTTINKGAKQ